MKVSDSDSASLTASSFETPSNNNSNPNTSRRQNMMIINQRASRSRKLADSRLSTLTINKLKIQSIGIIGRERETEILQERLCPLIQQANNAVDINANDVNVSDEANSNRESSNSDSNSLPLSKTNKEIIFIKGFSGVGKTSLARVIRKKVNSTKRGFFVEGKFDLDHDSSKDEPYSGISKAYSELIRELWREDRDMLFDIGRKLCEILRTDVEPLTFLIPELEDVVSEYSTATFSDGSNMMEGVQERWKYSFRILTRLLTAHVKPLVIVIDDLQWADKASLDLIESLISDVQNVNPLMVIGCYRSNEVDETSDLSKSIQSLMGENKANKFGFDITEIALEGCGRNDVNKMIIKMMDTDDDESTKDLADLCFQRTLGNPFFVIEFMNMLQREDLVKFSFGTMKWVYDVSRIEAETMSTANVVEFLQSRMKKMPEDVQLLLSIAACLGPTFKVSILEMVWRNLIISRAESSKDFEGDRVPVLIEFMEEEMLIEQSSSSSSGYNNSDKYRWVHDKVQEAALSLLDVDEMSLKFQMGTILFLNLSAKDLDDELFDVADLISCGKGRHGEETTYSGDFAALCLKAATKAMRLSAFLASSRYIQNGIAMLPKSNSDMWISHQSLALELHTVGAQVELELGHAAKSKEYCEVVFERQEVDKTSKIPLRLVDIKRLSTVELKYDESIRNSLALLKDLKFKFRWNRSLVAVQVMTLLSRTIKDLLKQPKDFYLHRGPMTKKYSTICEVLGRISYASSHHTRIGEFLQMILCMCHIVQLTLQHGLCQQSGPNIAFIGCFAIIIFGKNEDAPRFREIALSAQRHFGRTFASQTLFAVYTYNLAWSLQLETIAGPLFQGYIHGMQNGEVDFAMHCLNGHSIQLPYCLGKPIDQILEECPKVVMQAEEVSQMSQMKMVKSLWQMYLHLRSPPPPPQQQQKEESSCCCLLEGKVHSIDACEGDELQLAWHNFGQFQLAFFYRDPSAPDKAIRRKLTTASNYHFTLMIETFHRCVCLYEAARNNATISKRKRRKYKKHAQKLRKVIHNWKQVGNPNVVYYCIFLDAEDAALEGKLEAAESFYKQAIQFVGRSGYLHHAALFNELYSDFLWDERKDREEAKYRLQEAIRYYQEWGALGVAERCLQKSNLLGGGIDFGRFLNSQFNTESAADGTPVTTTTKTTPTTASVASLFKSSDFSDLYQGDDWNLDSLVAEEEEEATPPSPPPAIFKSQEQIPKLFQSLDWDLSTVPTSTSLNDDAIAQAVAMQHSFEEAIAPTPTPPKPVPFADAFKSQDWTVGTISNDVSIHPTMMDHAPTPEAPKPTSYHKTAAVKNSIFNSRDWLATEFLGTHEEISISPAMFQLEEPATTATTTTILPSTIAPIAAAPEKTNWETMFIGQLQPAAPAPTTTTTTKKRKRKKRPKVVPEHKQYVEISQHDVLLGRGGKSNHHPGNKRYREEVENFRPLYASLTTDEEKTSMSQALVDVMEQLGGRFLEEDKVKQSGKNVSLGWYVVPNIVARRKASQALREDSNPEKRKAKRARFLAKKQQKAKMTMMQTV